MNQPLNLKYSIVELAQSIQKTPQAIHKFCNESGIDILSSKSRAFLEPQAMRQYLQKFGFTYSKGIICFQACKGGVGKTSLCYHMGIRMAQYGAKILLIDMDMQAHLTLALLKNEHLDFLVWQDILSGKTIDEAIIKLHPHLHLIPSHLDNSYLDKTISQSHKILYTLYVAEHLKRVKQNYDLIIIDCAPALSHINTAVSVASDKILIPVTPDIFSFDGLEKTLSELKTLESSFSKALEVMIILNRFDAREKNSLDVIANLKNKYGGLLCSTVVISSAEIKNSIASQEIIFDSRKNPPICRDIDALAKEVLDLKLPTYA